MFGISKMKEGNKERSFLGREQTNVNFVKVCVGFVDHGGVFKGLNLHKDKK